MKLVVATGLLVGLVLALVFWPATKHTDANPPALPPPVTSVHESPLVCPEDSRGVAPSSVGAGLEGSTQRVAHETAPPSSSPSEDAKSVSVSGQLVVGPAGAPEGLSLRLFLDEGATMDWAVPGGGKFSGELEEPLSRAAPFVGNQQAGPMVSCKYAYSRAVARDGRLELGQLAVGAPLLVDVRISRADGQDAIGESDLWVLYPTRTLGALDPGSFASRWILPRSLGSCTRECTVVADSLARGGHLVSFSRSGMGAAAIEESDVTHSEMAFHLEEKPLQSYSFRVVAGDTPVEGALVALKGPLDAVSKCESDWTPKVYGRTDSRGELTFDSLPLSLVERVEVSHGGHRVTDDVADSRTVAQELVLPEGWTTNGFLVRYVDANGNPIAGVIAHLDKTPLQPEGTGAVRVAAGTYQRPILTASAPGYVPNVRVLDTPPRGELQIKLGHSMSLEVEVVDQHGDAVEGATVMLLVPKGHRLPAQMLVSDELGRAAFEVTPGDVERRLHVNPPTPQAMWERGGSNDVGAAHTGEFAVPQGARQVAYVLYRREGEPSSLIVRALDLDTGSPVRIDRIALTTTGRRGAQYDVGAEARYGREVAEVVGLTEGEYVLWATSDQKSAVMAISVSPGQNEIECVVGAPRSVRGVINADAPGYPFEFTAIRAVIDGLNEEAPFSPDPDVWPPTSGARADDAGAFVLEGILSTFYSVRVTRPHNEMAPLLIGPDDAAPLTFVLGP